MHNQLFLKFLRIHFDTKTVTDHHGGLNGVKSHENGVFLYKSHQAEYFIKSRITDYFMLGCFGGWISGMSAFLIMPLFVSLLSMPRKLAGVRFFTFHAELLPHTEQVVFHKATLFGNVQRIYVDIVNLEKIEADRVPSALMWDSNVFDANFVWRDRQSLEMFVFDTSGIWNKEALEHPLLH